MTPARLRSRWASAFAAASVVLAVTPASSQEPAPASSQQPAPASSQEPVPSASPPTTVVIPTASPEEELERGFSNPPMMVGGVALGLTGLGATGLGVYLTLQGSTLSCVDCPGSSDDAPLVAGGLSAILLGLGMASSGAMLVVLGARDEPRGLRVRTIRVGAGDVTLGGEF